MDSFTPLSLGKLTYAFVPLPMMKTLFNLKINNLCYKPKYKLLQIDF